jgi:hypothetical protein
MNAGRRDHTSDNYGVTWDPSAALALEGSYSGTRRLRSQTLKLRKHRLVFLNVVRRAFPSRRYRGSIRGATVQLGASLPVSPLNQESGSTSLSIAES